MSSAKSLKTARHGNTRLSEFAKKSLKVNKFMKERVKLKKIMLQTHIKLSTVFNQGQENYLVKIKKSKIRRKISLNAYGVKKPFQDVISSKST